MIEKVLKRIKLPEIAISFLLNLYNERKIKVITEYGLTEEFVAGDGLDQIAGGDHDRPAAQRAALRLAAQYHAGEKEADRNDHARGARHRRDAAPRRAQGRGAGKAPGRPQSRLCRRARR